MRLGVVAPLFQESAARALEVGARAQEAGLDGLFAYDHLWPMGQPLRPALSPWPVLAALGARFSELSVGPLVARVTLYRAEDLTRRLRSLALVVPGGVIAALGTGDSLSREEDEAYGLSVRSARARRERLEEALVACAGLECWVGGTAPATVEVARRHHAALNLWQVDTATLAEHAALGPVTWAGELRDDVAAHLDELAAAGATWVVSSRADAIDAMSEWREGHALTRFR